MLVPSELQNLLLQVCDLFSSVAHLQLKDARLASAVVPRGRSPRQRSKAAENVTRCVTNEQQAWAGLCTPVQCLQADAMPCGAVLQAPLGKLMPRW